jgi:ubiquinone/menaquinone biosynthesis C-methylase UbiE
MQNRIAAAVLRAVCAEWSGKKELSILEVGGGTGATTAALLPELHPRKARYRFTDVSRFFIKRASEQFGDFSFLEYDLLDIDLDPSEQGYGPQSFDVIIAANVLHTAKYIDRALARLRGLLSASGVLIAIETTENTALQMLTLGHFDGVSHFQDHRRTANLPFLSVEGWQSSLRAAGFAHVGAVPARGAASKAWPQHVLVAHRAAL